MVRGDLFFLYTQQKKGDFMSYSIKISFFVCNKTHITLRRKKKKQ